MVGMLVCIAVGAMQVLARAVVSNHRCLPYLALKPSAGFVVIDRGFLPA